jgi:hypothetical protein
MDLTRVALPEVAWEPYIAQVWITEAELEIIYAALEQAKFADETENYTAGALYRSMPEVLAHIEALKPGGVEV